MARYRPEIGQWYKELPTGMVFEVVALDDQGGTIEVQCLEGELCEYDTDSWRELDLAAVAEPEDWRHPFEVDGDDSGDPDSPLHPDDWDNPLDRIEPDVINGLIDDPDI